MRISLKALRALHFASFTLSLLLILLASRAIPQTYTCPTYPSGSGFHAWAPRQYPYRNIKLTIDTDLNSNEIESIIAAFDAWNGVQSEACLPAYFDTSNIIYAANQTTSATELINSYWVGYSPELHSGYLALTGTSNRPSAATEIYANWRPGNNHANDWSLLQQTMMHEIGHTFDLGHSSCTTSVMGATVSPVITTYDINVLKAVYCPTPVYDCENCLDNWDCQRPGSCPLTGYWCQFPNNACDSMTPIVVDVAGDGIHLTNEFNGVRFDLDLDGKGDAIAWTSANSDDAWLSMDNDVNGQIDDGSELFGNFTDQPEPPDGESRNGFLALAVFDKPENGGNLDGVISKKDIVFGSLRLWQDINHNGISEASELFTLPQLGFSKLELNYTKSQEMDEYGNLFLYSSKLKDSHGAHLGRWAWDVVLRLNPDPPEQRH
jgi:hypothetical protein